MHYTIADYSRYKMAWQDRRI